VRSRTVCLSFSADSKLHLNNDKWQLLQPQAARQFHTLPPSMTVDPGKNHMPFQ